MADVHATNPFVRSDSHQSPFAFEPALFSPRTDDREPASGTFGYALVKSGPELPKEECEIEHESALEVLVLWGETVLHVAHLSPPRPFYVGEAVGNTPPVDFALAPELLGASRWQLIEIVDGTPQLIVPAHASLRLSNEPSPSRNGGADASSPRHVALVRGMVAEARLGELKFRVAEVGAGKPTERRLFAFGDRTSLACFGFSFLAQAAVLGAMALFTPALGLTDDEGLDQDRIYTIQQYLVSAAEREQQAQEGAEQSEGAASAPSQSAEAARGAAGKMGKVNAAAANHRAGVKGPSDNSDPHLAREQALREAQDFGVIGILNSMRGDPNALTVPWGRDTALGNDPLSAIGNMWGPDIGEAAGSGGLQLSGTDQGGGGLGTGIGLDRIGTCQGVFCSGLPGGFGRSFAHRAPPHVTSAPRLHAVGTTVVGGRLPPEVIQRVVRQNFGRFRQCYENGLRTNPNLAGRVAVRFVIGRDGAVSNAGNGGSDLPDSGVVSCVVSAYYGLSFPAPEGGVVSVVYPIVFEPGA